MNLNDNENILDLFQDDINLDKKVDVSKDITTKSNLPKICIKHSHIEINDYNLGDSSQLEFLFSIFDRIRRQRVPYGAEYDDKNKRLILPRGMNIDMLKRIFQCEPYVDKNHDPLVNTDPLPIKYLTRDERQLKILKFLIGADEYGYTKTKSQLSVNSTTGSGKTFITVAAMCITGARMILITSSINWLSQWRDKIKEYTKLTDDDIYTITGRGSIDKIFARDPLKYQVFMCSHATLNSYANNCKEGWDAVSDLFKHLQCGVKVYDEAHLFMNNMIKIDFHTNTRKTIYLTATPARSNNEEDVVYQEYFRNIPSIELFDPEIDPHVNYLAMLFYSSPTAADVRRFTVGQFQFDRNIYMNYLTNQPNFRKLVSIIIDMTLSIPGKILIYIGINDSIIDIQKYILEQFPFLNGCVGIYTSLVTDPQLRHDMLLKKYILSTTKSCGAASDIPDLAACVVLNEPFKSKVIARQTLGRCRNDNTLYIDCIDMSVFRTKIYYQAKKPVFHQYAKSCREIFYSNEDLDAKYDEVMDKWKCKTVMTKPVFKQ